MTAHRFEDGAAYERMNGTWTRLVGPTFLDWIAPSPGLRWLDVGCGNGAFTEQIIERCNPAEVKGIDISDGQLAFARQRDGTQMAKFIQANAMDLPFDGDSFDVTVMTLVIFFVSDPAKSVAEMTRVTRPGGTVAAYAWDNVGGGSPLEPFLAELRAMGIENQATVSDQASRLESMRDLWKAAGLQGVRTRIIEVERSFPSFEELWDTTVEGTSLARIVSSMTSETLAEFKGRVRHRLQAIAEQPVSYGAVANAVTGVVP